MSSPCSVGQHADASSAACIQTSDQHAHVRARQRARVKRMRGSQMGCEITLSPSPDALTHAQSCTHAIRCGVRNPRSTSRHMNSSVRCSSAASAVGSQRRWHASNASHALGFHHEDRPVIMCGISGMMSSVSSPSNQRAPRCSSMSSIMASDAIGLISAHT